MRPDHFVAHLILVSAAVFTAAFAVPSLVFSDAFFRAQEPSNPPLPQPHVEPPVEEPALTDAPPPPPYTDPNQAIVNGLGGVGFSMGWTKQVPITTAIDLLSGTSPSATAMRNFLRAGYRGSTLWQPGNFAVNPRMVTIKRISDDASDANLAICVRLGPATDGGLSSSPLPALGCSDVNAQGDAGGCYLTATNDSCTLTLRPMLSNCGTDPTIGPTWDLCHEPVWIVASGGNNNGSLVAVSLWQ